MRRMACLRDDRPDAGRYVSDRSAHVFDAAIQLVGRRRSLSLGANPTGHAVWDGWPKQKTITPFVTHTQAQQE